ncbi:MAG: methyltransferase domain-containing protein [Gammaproteobacteria bacterium]
MKCRHCVTELKHQFVDLGFAPPSNAFVSSENYNSPEIWFPLKVLVCDKCWLVQTEDHAGREELFTNEYAYFSSFSQSWLEHANNYVKSVKERFDLNEASLICEVAANDGYLLQYVKAERIPCYGIEPTKGTANAAKEKGIDIIGEFFGRELAKRLLVEGKATDHMIANNVLAHVPDINDFVSGFTILLKANGVVTFEFPHLLNLIEQMQFDTIYHEHYSYLSLTSVKTVLEDNGLAIFDVEELSTHGGSLRVFAQKLESSRQAVSPNVGIILEKENLANMNNISAYQKFQAKTEAVKNGLLKFLIEVEEQGKTVAAYGAAAKGNTILNFAGIRSDLLPFVVDRNPNKSGQFMPGSHIPVYEESALKKYKPDYVLILPWNLKNEITQQLDYIKEWNGKCVIAIPEIEIID